MENRQEHSESPSVATVNRQEKDKPKRSARNATMWLLLGLILAIGIFAGGVKLRSWLWDHTRPVRFHPDLLNAMNWGNRVLHNAQGISVDAPAHSWRGEYGPLWKAYVGLYDDLVEHPPQVKQKLDYAPIRLAVAVLWARYVHHLPEKQVQPWDDSAIAFMLRINLFMELVAAAAIFGLVLHWSRRQQEAERLDPSPVPAVGQSRMQRFGRQSWAPWVMASLAALFLWLDPAVLLDAHVWPQWDIAVAAFFLTAALAVSTDACLTAGLLIGIGCMWKGQILIVAPVLVLWPVFAGQWRQVLRIAAGFIGAVAMVASPWLIPNAAGWIVLALWITGAAIAGAWFFKQRRHRAAWLAGALGVGAFAIALLLGGSFAWFKIGFIQGAGLFQKMYQGMTINLPAALQSQWHWGLHDLVLGPLSIGWLLKLTYAAILILCAYGAARYARRGSARTLIALATPWLAMFAVLGQMHERYLMYAAAITCAYVAVNAGMTLIHFLISLLACVPILYALLHQNPDWWPWGLDFVHRLLPLATIIVLVVTIFCVYAAVTTRPPWRWRINRLPDPIPE